MIAAALRGAAGVALAALFAAGLAALASRPLGSEPTGAAVRLALRTARAHVEVCRDRTADELAALPAHMRQPRVCEDHRPDYRLELIADGVPLWTERVEPPGMRRDRPLTVDALVPVMPGRRELVVAFTPEPAAGASALPAGSPAPPAWRLACVAELLPGRILLVVVDGDTMRVAGGECAAPGLPGSPSARATPIRGAPRPKGVPVPPTRLAS